MEVLLAIALTCRSLVSFFFTKDTNEDEGAILNLCLLFLIMLASLVITNPYNSILQQLVSRKN